MEASWDGGMGVDDGRLAGDSGGGGRGERKTLGGKRKLVQFIRDPECDGNVPPTNQIDWRAIELAI